MSGLLPPNVLSYTGQVVTPFIDETFAPLPSNYQFNVPTIWIDYEHQKAWILVAKPMNQAVWLLFTGGTGVILQLTPDEGDIVQPDDGNVNVFGDGTFIKTVGNNTTHTLTIEGIAGSIVSKFTVDAHTNPGTNPVVPDATGNVTITGGQVAAGTTANVIRTDSLAANTYTIQVQRSQAVASSTVGDNGVCHFSSADFTVDTNGFVQAKSVSFNYTAVTGPITYVVMNTDYYISCDSSAGAITLEFPNAPTAYQLWIVKDRTGTAAINNISLTTSGGTDTFDGLTTYIMNSNYQAINLLANAQKTYEVY
jgi:hypothetical protein